MINDFFLSNKFLNIKLLKSSIFFIHLLPRMCSIFFKDIKKVSENLFLREFLNAIESDESAKNIIKPLLPHLIF